MQVQQLRYILVPSLVRRNDPQEGRSWKVAVRALLLPRCHIAHTTVIVVHRNRRTSQGRLSVLQNAQYVLHQSTTSLDGDGGQAALPRQAFIIVVLVQVVTGRNDYRTMRIIHRPATTTECLSLQRSSSSKNIRDNLLHLVKSFRR
jgi:hypothetical protein